MKTRPIILALAALAVLVSFTVVSVRKPEAKAVEVKKEKQGSVYHNEPLGGFFAEDRL